VITPFWSSSGGAPQVRWIEREERAVAVKLLGGELGTVYIRVMISYRIDDAYNHIGFIFTLTILRH